MLPTWILKNTSSFDCQSIWGGIDYCSGLWNSHSFSNCILKYKTHFLSFVLDHDTNRYIICIDNLRHRMGCFTLPTIYPFLILWEKMPVTSVYCCGNLPCIMSFDLRMVFTFLLKTTIFRFFRVRSICYASNWFCCYSI